MIRPSWQDYGTYDESAYPEYWDGVVGAWCPSLGPTGSRLFDHSRFGNWGTLQQMVLADDWVINGGQYALDFDGSDDRVSIGTDARYNNTLWSCSLWIKPASTAAGQKSILAQIDSTGNLGRAIRRNANQIEYSIASSGAFAQYKSGTTITTDWTHVAVSVSGVGTPRIWVNGAESTVTLTASSGTVVLPAAQPLYIGVDGQFGTTNTTYNFAGLVDDVQIYSQLMHPNRSLDLYLLGRGGMYQRRRRSRRRAIEQAVSGVRRRRLLTGMV